MNNNIAMISLIRPTKLQPNSPRFAPQYLESAPRELLTKKHIGSRVREFVVPLNLHPQKENTSNDLELFPLLLSSGMTLPVDQFNTRTGLEKLGSSSFIV